MAHFTWRQPVTRARYSCLTYYVHVCFSGGQGRRRCRTWDLRRVWESTGTCWFCSGRSRGCRGWRRRPRAPTSTRDGSLPSTTSASPSPPSSSTRRRSQRTDAAEEGDDVLSFGFLIFSLLLHGQWIGDFVGGGVSGMDIVDLLTMVVSALISWLPGRLLQFYMLESLKITL